MGCILLIGMDYAFAVLFSSDTAASIYSLSLAYSWGFRKTSIYDSYEHGPHGPNLAFTFIKHLNRGEQR